MMGPTSFEQLIRRLFEEQFESLFRYLDRLSGDPEAAADLAQETFVRLYQRGYMPDDPRAWLAAVANNLFRDDRRRTRRRARLLEVNAPELVREPVVSADAALVRDEERARVRAALDALPERERRMLLLRHEGLSYREIARAIGVMETSVGTMLVRATTAFRAALEQRHERARREERRHDETRHGAPE